MCQNIMESEARQSYIAKALVFSEVASIIQSTVNVHGGSLSYINLFVFALLCFPLLLRTKFTIFELLVTLLFFSFVTAKVMIQGLGEYYIKSAIILLILPVYAVLAARTSLEDIADECFKRRHLILFLGIVYIVSWYFLGTYRNASTVTIFLMLVLAFKNVFDIALSLIFAAVMKTQYKIWAIISFGNCILKSGGLKRVTLFLMGLGAALIPIVLMYIDLSWAGFNASQLSSLEERLSEVRAFIETLSLSVFYWFVGWPLGQLIDGDSLSVRGYMHSAYLWVIGTMGIPFALVLFSCLFLKRSETRRFFFIRAFLVLSNAFTFLLLTNPLCTTMMFTNENKKPK